MQQPVVAAIAAIGKNRELGKDNKLLWRIPEDLKRFKAMTAGHPVIMGRKTFESIVGYLGGPLPGRTNIVVTRSPGRLLARGVTSVGSIEEAIQKAREADSEEIFVIGGASVYQGALPYVDRLYLTIVDDEKDADSFFPAYEKEFARIVHEEAHESNGLKYRWVDLERV